MPPPASEGVLFNFLLLLCAIGTNYFAILYLSLALESGNVAATSSGDRCCVLVQFR